MWGPCVCIAVVQTGWKRGDWRSGAGRRRGAGGCADEELSKKDKGKMKCKTNPHQPAKNLFWNRFFSNACQMQSLHWLTSCSGQHSLLPHSTENTSCTVLGRRRPWPECDPHSCGQENLLRSSGIYCKLRQRLAPTQGWPDPWFTQDRQKVPSSLGCQWHRYGWLSSRNSSWGLNS